ncbi:OTU deubiquitinase with linear linkage specificity a isoform 2-T2 [Aulostomus maculatus]
MLTTLEWHDGFVDGADAGEEASLQVGFNMGYRDGAAQTVAVGRLKGIASAIWCWCQIQHPEAPIPASVSDLLQRVSQHEDAIKDRIRRALENPTPSVSDVSESMDDLEVEQTGPGRCGEGCKKTDCCGKGEKMDLDSPQQRKCSGSSDGSTGLAESLKNLLQLCMDVVSQLGLPQELTAHIGELEDI